MISTSSPPATSAGSAARSSCSSSASAAAPAAGKLVDCGASLFYQEQDTHAGGSGCGCVASVSCGWLMKRMERGELGKVLLVGSGAMLSPTSTMQSESIPGIAYAVRLEVK